MRIAVCIKQVPDAEGRLKVAADGKWIDEDEIQFVINESDQYALEEALTLTEAHGGEVVVLSLGPDRVQDALRKALALGAKRAIHLEDSAFQGGDAHATARALAAAIQAEECDLVLTGAQSDDAGYGSTGSVLAGLLGWPHAWLVMGLEVEEGGTSAQVTREMESGMNELFRLQLPAVIEVQAGMNHPRYASLKGIMQAKRKPVDRPTPDDLGLTADQVGAAGSRLEIVDVAFPETDAGAQIFEGDAATAAKALLEKLRNEARVL
ncbi:MAG: electron transfer flavoprotein subunit beta/FixA family protein [Acidobacteriota bacterium]